MRGSLTLTLYENSGDTSPLIVVISEFLATGPPRTDTALGGESSYSKAGNYLQSGTSFEIPAFWNINGLVKEEIGDRLIAMWGIREEKRMGRIAPSPTGYRFELDDETMKVHEYGRTPLTKTRSNVVGTTPYIADKGVHYFARWLVDMDAKPVLGKVEDGYQSASFKLNDVGIKI